MNLETCKTYITKTYHAEPEYPWSTTPNSAVFRHQGNQKWFALTLSVPKEKLGLSEKENLDLLNVKCEPAMIGSFLQDTGIYPAYHMNKTHWLSIALDGSAAEETIKILLAMSFELTAPKSKKMLPA